MNTIIDRFEKIKLNIASIKSDKPVNIIAVSKTFTLEYIQPLINHGHNHFGENKVQEALAKWSEQKKENHKAKDAVKLFDYIHSVDNQKLADTLAKHQKNINKSLKYFIQVNIGNEVQKSGIPVGELDAFYNYCTNEIDLKIIGLMVIPPLNDNTEKYFKSLNKGMSADYLEAIKNGSNFVRIGSSIFGPRS